jgi:hypothetical protein
MANEKVIISRIMNDNFVLVLYKRFGIPQDMNVRIYINKLSDNFKDKVDDIFYNHNGYNFKYINDNVPNDFLFEHFKNWKHMIDFQFKDGLKNYIYILRDIKDFILNEIDYKQNKRYRDLEDKFVFKP